VRDARLAQSRDRCALLKTLPRVIGEGYRSTATHQACIVGGDNPEENGFDACLYSKEHDNSYNHVEQNFSNPPGGWYLSIRHMRFHLANEMEGRVVRLAAQKTVCGPENRARFIGE
jgi:hypothetical protein